MADIYLGSIGETRLFMEANQTGTQDEIGLDGRVKIPLYTLIAIRVERPLKKPIMRSKDRPTTSVISPRETAGVVYVQLLFDHEKSYSLVLNEATDTISRLEFARAIVNVTSPGISMGWTIQPLRTR